MKVICPNCERQVIVACPKCGCRFDEMEPEIYEFGVECLKCGHKWRYKGMFNRRIECPGCGSTQNDKNRSKFGDWTPDELE